VAARLTATGFEAAGRALALTTRRADLLAGAVLATRRTGFRTAERLATLGRAARAARAGRADFRPFREALAAWRRGAVFFAVRTFLAFPAFLAFLAFFAFLAVPAAEAFLDSARLGLLAIRRPFSGQRGDIDTASISVVSSSAYPNSAGPSLRAGAPAVQGHA
jgi:hypothetical protein